ncbi:hypothetical protein JST97_23430 [bacterium]|nr:hypothetical protein [bacterium]
MSDFFQQLRGQAQLETRGEFTLDIEQAAQKMARFQFPQPQDFLPHLVAGLFRLGATSLFVNQQEGRLTLELPPLEMPVQLLERLPEAIFDERSGQRRLAAAVQSLLAFNPTRFSWIGNQPAQTYDYISGQKQNWGTHLTEIQIEGLPPKLIEAALQELCKRGGWSRRPLQVGQRRFQWPFECTTELGGFPAYCEWQPGDKPRLLLIMDEIVCEFRAVPAPFAWTGLCYGEFSLDASMAKVLEDERLTLLLEDIPKSFGSSIRAALGQVAPEEIFPLLQKPAPSWLESVEPELLRMKLFRDQDGCYRSLDQLLSTPGTIYYAYGADFKQLDPIVLVNPSSSALNCLESYLGSRLEKADQLVVRRLQREHNHRLWSAQPIEKLSLSPRHWLYQSEFRKGDVRWLVGIPDDWSRMGATLAIWVEGRKLAACQLLMQEVCCEIACEIPSAHVNELWTGLADRFWTELEPAWNASVRQLVDSLIQGQEPQVELRDSLKKHLADQQRPQDSYFRHTLLFQDWKGQCYSLDQLLKLPAHVTLGVVGPHFLAENFTDKIIPQGVFLRNSGPELEILSKTGISNLLILDYFLEDLLLARQSAFTESDLVPQPAFGIATFWFSVDGIKLAPCSQGFPYAFLARICCSDLPVEASRQNQNLGIERFRLVMNEATQARLDELKAGYFGDLRAHLDGRLSLRWLEWMREATLRGLCQDFLRELACWPRYPGGLASLHELSQCPRVYWCSGEAGELPAEVEWLLPRLTHSVQSALRRAAGGGEWICLDEDFARHRREQELLAQAPWTPPIWGVLAERKPDLWLLPQGAGLVNWLYRGRLLNQESGLVPYGFQLAVECASPEPQGRPDASQFSQQCYSLLREYLALPRPALWEHWKSWLQQNLPPEVELLLQDQRWFDTSRGLMSWRELLAEPEVWLYPSRGRDIPAEMLVIFDRNLASQMVSSHPGGHSIEETAAKLQAEELLRSLRQQQHIRMEALERLPHRLRLDFGAVALSLNKQRDFWWLGPDKQLLIDNIPVGITGYATCPIQPQILRTGETVAELNPPERQQILQAAAQLLKNRVVAGCLQPVELLLFCEVCGERPELEGVRWLECADGTYTSIQQLRQQEGPIYYWPRKYFLRSGGPALLPILSSPLMVEIVAQICGRSPQLYPPPLLHREVSFSGIKNALSALGKAVCQMESGSLLAGMRRILSPPVDETDPQAGRVLIDCLQRRAAQLLSGPARELLLEHLAQARLQPGRRAVWEVENGLVLYRDHPKLRPWLGLDEPPLQVQTSLLLSLVCAINAMSNAFTDEMEVELLEHLADQVLESRPR